jgi:hypothetical protein
MMKRAPKIVFSKAHRRRGMASVEEIMVTAGTLRPEERLHLIERLWESLPSDSWPALGDGQLAAAQRRMMNSDARWMEPVPWPVVEQLVADCLRSARPKVYSAPRRFDLATIFIVTIVYSLLFAGMSLLQFPPFVSLAVAGFITFVGIGQALLFGGKRPRTASLIVGTFIYTLTGLVIWISYGSRMYATSAFLFGGTFAIIGGAVLGYLAGACVGAVFMLAEFLRCGLGWTAHRKQNAADEES